jgi:hypothetical protein
MAPIADAMGSTLVEDSDAEPLKEAWEYIVQRMM